MISLRAMRPHLLLLGDLILTLQVVVSLVVIVGVWFTIAPARRTR